MTDTQTDSDVDVFEEAGSNELGSADPDWVGLPRCDLLSIEEADELLRWLPATLVAVVGERKSGKTTLITEIYERFLRGPFAGQMFCYSQTLLGFERKSYPSRAESRLERPDTARTSTRDGLRFFHLGLVSSSNRRRADLLITERAGEVYRDARDRPAESRTLLELLKARTVVFVLDGERIANDKTRAEAFASIRGMIRAFADAGAISGRAEIQLVTTKFDLLSAAVAAEAVGHLKEFEDRLVKAYSGRFAKVTHWRTAARDPKGQLEPAWGVTPVLRSWIDPPGSPPGASSTIPKLDDEFDRLLLRRGRLA
ncbi:TRAFAC clade GTPase domain-containing protein [Bradyrhizobium stylosanthis]|uniref:Double-GTPase 2 domain-containing protein n=1 Tax=Bradyrhizobium stylosanthis TaxID=1803665 RepID=A0A560D699_9BRAD|nr:hypothetical protein [Bradyrhizobium stylosanthis]TWA92611.1 hypothetical protein FBZ96_11081 [Bradyrhizobium stylosanthis]